MVLEFGRELANATPAAFVERLFVGRLGAVAVVQGGNFRFGRGRRGDLGVLRELGARHGFEVIEAPAVERGGEVVSSTRIRQATRHRGPRPRRRPPRPSLRSRRRGGPGPGEGP